MQPTEQLAGDIQWIASDIIEARTVEGVVYDLGTGELLTAAQIWIPTLAVGVLSQLEGRFRLRASEAGVHEVHVARIGYVTRAVLVMVPADRGVAASVGLRRAPADLCGDMIYHPDAILPRGPQVRVEVRDVIGGRAPRIPITVRAEGLLSVDSTVVAPVEAESLLAELTLSAAYRRTGGTVSVSVWSVAHVAWTTSDVSLEHACPFARTPILPVWLLPRGR
jgi:hypothetical protein